MTAWILAYFLTFLTFMPICGFHPGVAAFCTVVMGLPIALFWGFVLIGVLGINDGKRKRR